MALTKCACARSLIAGLTLGAGVLLSALPATVSVATAQELEWARRAGSPTTGDDEEGHGIATDGRGDSYVTGQFRGTATFGAGEDNETQLTVKGSSDGDNMFIAKYDPSGLLVWAKQADGVESIGRSIATDSPGNSYITGLFEGTVTFGAGEDNETVLRVKGTSAINNMFVAKYDRNGSLLWAKQVSGDFASGEGVSTDNRGNDYVTGYFLGMMTFGAGEDKQIVLTAEQYDFFIAKYDPNGKLLWAKQAFTGSSPSNASGNGIANDGGGNSYVTGNVSGTVTFEAGEDNETVLTTDQYDFFIAKYDPNGKLLWAKQTVTGSSPSYAFGKGIATDGGGNSYVTGNALGTVTFNAGEDNEIMLGSGIFVAKYDRNGRLVWAKHAGGDFDSGLAITSDNRGNCYATGFFEGTATFGAGEDNESVLSAPRSGVHDIFVAKYDRNGLLVWAKQAGRATDDGIFGEGIATDNSSNSYITGNFNSTATFGAGERNETQLKAAGVRDIFVAKWSAATARADLLSQP